LLQQVKAVARREVVEIEIGDGGRGIGVDEDGVLPSSALCTMATREKLFHLTNHSWASVWPWRG